FQSGVFNPVSGLYVIRASDAHSWVEGFLPGGGWTVFDPTPPAARAMGTSVFSQAAMYLDAAETFWQEWVVNYDLNRQITLAERLQETTQLATAKWNPDFPSWSKEWRRKIAQRGPVMAAVLSAALLLLFAGPALVRFLQLTIHGYKVRSGRATAGDATVLYGRMLRVLAKQGFHKPAWFTPAEFAASLPPSPLASTVAEFTDRYQEFRFGNHASNGRHLDSLLKRMREL
ncbi:MAG: transglutaminase domain-containing protein, partial [Acidobacteriota bacterium]|nr:transglutaminase domain-containing protein [Acidobacteriota bacterium]